MSETPGFSDSHQPGRYEIRLRGYLATRWAATFDGLELVHEPDGTTVLQGRVADQSALHGLLRKVRDVGLPLVSVVEIEPVELVARTERFRSDAPTPVLYEGN